MKNPKILVLGVQGMLGRFVLLYLTEKFSDSVFGTAREKTEIKNIFFLSVNSFEKDIKNIINNNRKIEYIINCIASIKNDAKENELDIINAEFPKKLAEFSEKQNIKVLHVSTDAVFDDASGIVTESNQPFPENKYGESKLSGEPDSSHTISIRTSIVGFAPGKNKGLLEWAMREKKDIQGFANQYWSGSTVLQFAELCEKIIRKDSFKTLRKKSRIFHFAPIANITKYELLKEFYKILGKKNEVKKNYGKTITRQLKTLFPDELFLNEFTQNIGISLKELLEFERIQR